MTPTPARSVGDRVRRSVWVGLALAVFYVIVAAGGGLIVDAVLGDEPDPVLENALAHLLPLPIAIAVGLVFVWRSGWWRDVWSPTPIRANRPRRLWMFAVPIAVVVQIVLLVVQAPLATLTAPYVLVGLVSYLLVGLGEELFFRGILLQSVQARHGETVTLLITALSFGLAHSIGSAVHGIPAGAIAFQVAVTAVDGVVFYAILRVTGTLWAPIVLHGLGDYGRWLSAGDGQDHTSAGDAAVQILLSVLAAAVLVSAIRADLRTRRDARATPGQAETVG